jgi:hypothetical protein
MFPVGTEVSYKGHHGYVNFCDPETGCCTICIRVFPDEPVRNVCLVVYKTELEYVIPIIGNHSRSDDY